MLIMVILAINIFGTRRRANSWDEFARMFLQTFQDYDCTQVFLELENLCRIEGESYEDFSLRFKLIFFKFQSKYFPSQLELIGWFRHILSLPCTNHNEQEDTIFLSVLTIVDEHVVDYIQTENVEIMNEKSQENMNTSTKINDVPETVLKHDNSAKEENPQSVIQIENINSNDSINDMLPTTITSEFYDTVNNFQSHDSDY
jgi:hypothetical protein